MSSDEEDYKRDGRRSDSASARAKRKGRACDLCRHKKVRCDGQPGERCSNCTASQQECTYMREAKKRYPDAERIKSLETELANMKKLLNKLHPGVDFSRELSGILDENSLWLIDAKRGSSSEPRNTTVQLGPPSAVPPASPAVASSAGTSPSAENYDSSDDEIGSHIDLKHSMEALNLNAQYPRYLGKSSRVRFFKRAYDLKHDYTGQDPKDPTLYGQRLRLTLGRVKYQKNEKWIMKALEAVDNPNYRFPPPDLLASLVELYFTMFNVFIPLLHRPTFEACVASGLHFEDEGFGSLLMMVCAMGSRFSEDTRVLAEGTSNRHSAGWPWFSQVYAHRKAMKLRPPCLYDIQIPALVALYLHGTSLNQPSWPIIGLGLRLAQDMGAHRKRSYELRPTVEGELMRRAFWVLVSLDRSQSFTLGRPCSLQDEDIDVDFPTECDDEYWITADPEQAFKQPLGKPSTVTFFNVSLRLKSIHAFCLRTIYSITKSKVLQGYVGPEWEHRIVSDIDSALNQWIDSVPEHLKWNPHQENLIWLNQSASLYSTYYNTQINVHRRFIPSPRKSSPLSFPALAICTNAARSCIHIVDVQQRRGAMAVYLNQAALFSASIVLLLNIWGSKRAGAKSVNAMKDLEEVHKAMDILKSVTPQVYIAGRYRDVLCDLAESGDLPLPPSDTPSSSHKRHRYEDHPSPASTSSDSQSGEPRHIAGTRRVQAYQEAHSSSVNGVDTTSFSDGSAFELPNDFVLPLHSDELRHMPQTDQTWGSYDITGIFDSVFSAPPTNGQQQGDMSSAMVHDLPQNGFAGMANAPYTPSGMPPGAPRHSQMFAGPSMTVPPAPQAVNGVDQQTYHNGFQTAPAGAGDTLAMWSTAPEGFEWDDWGMFISSMNPPMNNSQN